MLNEASFPSSVSVQRAFLTPMSGHVKSARITENFGAAQGFDIGVKIARGTILNNKYSSQEGHARCQPDAPSGAPATGSLPGSVDRKERS